MPSSTAPGRRGGLAALLALALAACTDPSTGPNANVAGNGRDPILFVHGWNSGGSTWNTMIARFKADGWTSAQLHAWSYNSSLSNATTAAVIRGKVDSIRGATGAARVDLVTHSMGALSARYYVRNLDGDGKVDALVSLGGPNHGTSTALFCFQTACTEMRANSKFLTALNATDETWGSPRYATWWSSCDEVVYPQSSTPLAGALNTKTAACLKHNALKEDAAVYAQVRDLVQPPLVASGTTSGI